MTQPSTLVGLALLSGGLMQLGTSLRMRRRGSPWRGPAIGGFAGASWGMMTLTGVWPGAGHSGVLTVIAALVWMGVALSFIDNRRSPRN